MRSVLVAALFLLPGCVFSEFDRGCPDMLTVVATHVTQVLAGTWDVERPWAAANATSVWTLWTGEEIVFNLTEDTEGPSGVILPALPAADGTNITVRTVMTFGDSRCVAPAASAAEVERTRGSTARPGRRGATPSPPTSASLPRKRRTGCSTSRTWASSPARA